MAVDDIDGNEALELVHAQNRWRVDEPLQLNIRQPNGELLLDGVLHSDFQVGDLVDVVPLEQAHVSAPPAEAGSVTPTSLLELS